MWERRARDHVPLPAAVHDSEDIFQEGSHLQCHYIEDLTGSPALGIERLSPEPQSKAVVDLASDVSSWHAYGGWRSRSVRHETGGTRNVSRDGLIKVKSKGEGKRRKVWEHGMWFLGNNEIYHFYNKYCSLWLWRFALLSVYEATLCLITHYVGCCEEVYTE